MTALQLRCTETLQILTVAQQLGGGESRINDIDMYVTYDVTYIVARRKDAVLAAGYFDAPAARQACLGGRLMSSPLQPPLPLVTLVFCAIEGLADVKV